MKKRNYHPPPLLAGLDPKEEFSHVSLDFAYLTGTDLLYGYMFPSFNGTLRVASL
jgi:hypothetical protein